MKLRENPAMSTGDVARVLAITRNGVRWLERTGVLRCERTLGGRRVFRLRDVEQLVVARARRNHPALAAVRPRMARAALGQLTLPMALRRAKKAKDVLHQGEANVVAFRRKRGHVA